MAAKASRAIEGTNNKILEYLKEETNVTRTVNGAITYKSATNACLDLFSTIGALRNAADEEIWSRFLKAYTESPDLAMKILFYARDVRGGLGERRVFRTIYTRLAAYEPEAAAKNVRWISRFGRFDDLLPLLHTACAGKVQEVIKAQWEEDLKALEAGKVSISLLAKWLPSVNASSRETVACARESVSWKTICVSLITPFLMRRYPPGQSSNIEEPSSAMTMSATAST